MNSLLVILFIALFLCAVMLGATRSPKAKGIADPAGSRKLGIYMVLIIAAIIIVGIVKSNSQEAIVGATSFQGKISIC